MSIMDVYGADERHPDFPAEAAALAYRMTHNGREPAHVEDAEAWETARRRAQCDYDDPRPHYTDERGYSYLWLSGPEEED